MIDKHSRKDITDRLVSQALTKADLYKLLTYTYPDRRIASFNKYGVHLMEKPIMDKIVELEFEDTFLTSSKGETNNG